MSEGYLALVRGVILRSLDEPGGPVWRDWQASLFEVGERLCSSCRRILPVDEFLPHSAGASQGLRSDCRACANAVRRSWDERNPERSRIAKARGRAVRRMREAEAHVESFDPLEVFERDGWICGVCDREIDRRLSWPDPASVSLDHVFPLAKGGTHERTNAQPAHLTCNRRKRDRVA